MPHPVRRILCRVLKLSPDEVSVARRGFSVQSGSVGMRLEVIGRTVLDGYHAALRSASAAELVHELEEVELERRGFAYEGAGMGQALVDVLACRGLRRFDALRRACDDRHVYMMHVGAGLARARLGCRAVLPLRGFDPLLGALVVEGAGFHAGFFHSDRFAGGQPARARGVCARIFDQGLGRSLWFVQGADPDGLALAVLRFDVARHASLWSGIGLACAYAGGVERESIERLLELAGEHGADVAQGAAFAAEARHRAQNPAAHTRVACEVLCGSSDAEAAALARATRTGLAPAADGSAYEAWRGRLRACFAARAGVTG